jgi:hypothetical protein
MFCPRCGAENDDANRFCVNCGSELAKEEGAEESPASPRERLGRLIGTTRRARLVTVATVIAIVIAVVAFLSLDSDEGGATANSAYLESVDQACVAEKERISTLEEEVLRRRSLNPQEFASVLVTALAEWRAKLRQTPPPPEDAEEIQAMETALLTTLVEAAKLSRSIREGGSTLSISRQAQAVDESTREVNQTIESIGLSDCADLQVSPATEVQP